MLVGGIRSLEEAERLVAGGYTDYIALSRPFICEPDLVARWESGDRAPSACRSDNRCFYKGLKGEGMSACTRSAPGRRDSETWAEANGSPSSARA